MGWLCAGLKVILGSRKADRAKEAAAELRAAAKVEHITPGFR